jgi:hypothetical protein
MATKRRPPQISIRKVRLNAGGYSPGKYGRYYGNAPGTSIYEVVGAFISVTGRAESREHAAVVALLNHDTFGSQRDSVDWQADRAALVAIGSRAVSAKEKANARLAALAQRRGRRKNPCTR